MLFQDCDVFGHLNNARYIDYFRVLYEGEVCREDLNQRVSQLKKLQRMATTPVVEM